MINERWFFKKNKWDKKKKKKEEKIKKEKEKEIKNKYLNETIPFLIEEIKNYFLNGNDELALKLVSQFNIDEDNEDEIVFLDDGKDYLCYTNINMFPNSEKINFLLPFNEEELFRILKKSLKGLKISIDYNNDILLKI